ncbi:MAG: sigma-54 dependent transcriptional regulator [Planctomycetota bacterium]|nr:sigma-54 dependent transcriptional regulator [Planctomycetota bacterium]
MPDSARVLLIDDEREILRSFSTSLKLSGYRDVFECSDSREALDKVESLAPDVVVLDLIMPHVTGEEVLSEMTANHPDTPVIVVTGNTDVQSAVNCVKLGAFDYITKPVDKARLLTTIEVALRHRRSLAEINVLREGIQACELKNPDAFSGIITQNSRMRSLFQFIEAMAPTSAVVLITGETGVGKELFARAIHNSSARKGRFIGLTVSGLDDTMFSDSLFGHRKGAFTGAESTREGLLAQAADGTLFLDEIGDLSHNSQLKLLRLLQENEYYPVGSDKVVPSSARIVTATNRSIDEIKSSPEFRNDLFFRLYAHTLVVPPLRERPDDIKLLLDHFLNLQASELGVRVPSYPPQLLDLLVSYDFPGNVRELEALVLRALTFHRSGMLSLSVFEEHIRTENERRFAELEGSVDGERLFFPTVLPSLKEVKRLLVEEALRRTNGNISLAARMLGVTRKALSWYTPSE